MDLDDRLGLDVAQALHVHEGRVEEVACRRRDHRQRIARRQLRRRRDRLPRRHEVRQAPAGHVDAHPPVRRRKAPVGERRVGNRQADPAGRGLQRLESHRAAQRLRGQRLVAVAEARLVEAHRGGQAAEDLGVGQRLAERRNRRLVQQHVGVAVAGVQVEVLELRRRRQHPVGVVGGVGQEVLQHDGEQILPRKAARHLRRLRRHRDRVAVVDDQRLDLRAEVGRGLAQQVVADGAHVDRARHAAGEQVRALARRIVAHRREPARGGQQQAAGAVPPRPRQAGQQRDQPRRIAAAAGALHAVVQPDRRRLGRAPVSRQRADRIGVQAADLGRTLRRPGLHPLAQGHPAGRVHMGGDVVMVEPVVRHQLVHQRQRQRPVGAGPQRQVDVALVGRLGAARVDADQLRPGALGGLGEGPEMQVRRDRMAAPDDDQPALGEMPHQHADLAAIGGRQRVATGRGADGALELRGAQAVEEARRHALALQQAHRAGVAVGQDRLRVARGDRLQPTGDVGQRLVPARRLEAARALRAHAAQRRQHALGVMGALGVARDLGAERAVRRHMLGAALDAHDPPGGVVHADLHRAGVGAVVGAGGADGAQRVADGGAGGDAHGTG